MKLEALDQVSVSSVKSDSLRPGERFVVSDAYGSDLMKAHPDKFMKVDDTLPEEKPAPVPIAKAEKPPINKAEVAPANKADTRRKSDKDE